MTIQEHTIARSHSIRTPIMTCLLQDSEQVFQMFNYKLMTILYKAYGIFCKQEHNLSHVYLKNCLALFY